MQTIYFILAVAVVSTIIFALSTRADRGRARHPMAARPTPAFPQPTMAGSQAGSAPPIPATYQAVGTAAAVGAAAISVVVGAEAAIKPVSAGLFDLPQWQRAQAFRDIREYPGHFGIT